MMGTEARIVLYAQAESDARAAAQAAFDRMAVLEQVMSDWRDDSELSALSRAPAGVAQPLGADLFRVLERAVSIAQASEGAFDPSVGPLVTLWRAARTSKTLPDAETLAAARARVGFDAIDVNGGIRTVTLGKPGMKLDLGGIGKGFACDEGLKVLMASGAPRALVGLAGDIVCGNPPPDAEGWTVAIGKDGGTTLLANAAISTSGDAEQWVEIGGVRHAHIIDPATGLGLTRPVWATVIAKDGATADALATAVCVLGEEKGRALVRRFTGARVAAFTSR